VLQGISGKEGWNPRGVIERAAFALFPGQNGGGDWVLQRSACAPEVQLLPIGHTEEINLPSVWQHLAGSAALATPLLAAMVGFGATTLALLGALADRFAVFSAGG
jgi:hypothetical protein